MKFSHRAHLFKQALGKSPETLSEVRFKLTRRSFTGHRSTVQIFRNNLFQKCICADASISARGI